MADEGAGEDGEGERQVGAALVADGRGDGSGPATALQRNKTDARDAETREQLVRMGWYREARVKSYAAHAVRHLVGARAQLTGIAVDLSNQIRRTLKTFGLMAGKGAGRAFEIRVHDLIAARPTIAAIVEPLLAQTTIQR